MTETFLRSAKTEPQLLLTIAFPHIGPGLLHRPPELARRGWDRYSKGPSTSAAHRDHQEASDDGSSLDLLFTAQKNFWFCYYFDNGFGMFWWKCHTYKRICIKYLVFACLMVNLIFWNHLLSQTSCEPFASVGLRWSRCLRNMVQPLLGSRDWKCMEILQFPPDPVILSSRNEMVFPRLS